MTSVVLQAETFSPLGQATVDVADRMMRRMADALLDARHDDACNIARNLRTALADDEVIGTDNDVGAEVEARALTLADGLRKVADILNPK